MSYEHRSDNLHLEQLSWMFFATLRRMSRNVELHSRELEREYGLTVPQLNVLWAVGVGGRVPIGQVAERINLSGATVTSIVDRLEEHELVVRERSRDDKRQVLVSLTEQGRDLLAGGPQPFHDCFIARLRELERWQRTELLSAVQHVASMMEPSPLDERPGEDSREATELS
ncbi:MAG: MarR family winged helix-turn-helix transcriptional regulator [Spirochaetota bacterium]